MPEAAEPCSEPKQEKKVRWWWSLPKTPCSQDGLLCGCPVEGEINPSPSSTHFDAETHSDAYDPEDMNKSITY